MSEHRRDWPTGLPAPGETPVFVPPDPTALLRAGRRTRRMHALIAATAATALVAVGGAMAANATGNRADRVKVVTPATDHTLSPAPHHSSEPILVGLPDQPEAGGSALTGTDSVATGGDTSTSRANVSGPAPIASVNAAEMVPTATDFRRTTATEPTTTSCAYQPESAPSGWCLDYPGPASAPAGLPVDLSLDLCRIKGLGTGTLHFRDAQEANVSIYGQRRSESWTWSHGRQFAATPHMLTVRAGQCLRWTTRWTTRANNGTPLPRGTYSISVYVTSPDADLPNTVTGTATDFRLT